MLTTTTRTNEWMNEWWWSVFYYSLKITHRTERPNTHTLESMEKRKTIYQISSLKCLCILPCCVQSLMVAPLEQDFYSSIVWYIFPPVAIRINNQQERKTFLRTFHLWPLFIMNFWFIMLMTCIKIENNNNDGGDWFWFKKNLDELMWMRIFLTSSRSIRFFASGKILHFSISFDNTIMMMMMNISQKEKFHQTVWEKNIVHKLFSKQFFEFINEWNLYLKMKKMTIIIILYAEAPNNQKATLGKWKP